MTAGYSGTALAKKLGIREGRRVCVMNAPKGLREAGCPLPERVELVSRIDAKIAMVHIFATQRTRLGKALQAALGKLHPDAAI